MGSPRLKKKGGTGVRSIITAFMCVGVFIAFPALAQQSDNPSLNAAQTLGRQLLNQHCAICHLKPQLGAATYGPALNSETLGGKDVAIRDFISYGDPKMPGFRYQFSPAQIDAVIAYIKSVPAPAAAVTPVKQ
jgi:mono/diheme cytochrome c family protein